MRSGARGEGEKSRVAQPRNVPQRKLGRNVARDREWRESKPLAAKLQGKGSSMSGVSGLPSAT